MQLWYLGALRAGEEVAAYLEDEAFAKKCRPLFDSGSRWIDENLFNGKYYIHKIQTPDSKDDIAEGLMAGMGRKILIVPIINWHQTVCLIS